MKAFIRPLTSALTLMIGGLQAAPSIQMPHEWAAPLDGGKAMVLVQTETGQARIINFDPSFAGADSGPINTNLPGVTGVNSGLISAGQEHVIISSATTNSVRFLNINDLSLTSFQPEVPGPITAIPFRQLIADPPSVHQLSEYGDAAQVLQRYDDVFSPPPTPGGAEVSLFPVYDLQPLRIPGFPQVRAGLASIALGGDVNLYEVELVGGVTDYDFIVSGGSVGEKLASQCLGDDGRVCAIRYQTGGTQVSVVTLPYLGFLTGSLTSNVLPFPIGSITAIPPSVLNAPHGVLVTSVDGTSAIYAHIVGGQNLVTQATFTPQGANRLTGVIPVPGRGFVVMEGPTSSRVTTSWRGFQNNGGGWNSVNSGGLGAWLPAQVNFATMFWFNGTPLVDPMAEIIKFETRADWTRKTSSAPIPPQIELSELMTADQGLTPTSLVAPTAPSGASFLLTSQHENHVSITALDNDIALQSPSISLSPASGDYQNPVTVTALYDEAANELFYREDVPGSPWQSFESLTVGYPSSWLFYARNQSTNVAGPILRRDFTFATVNLNSLDSDFDTVPDHVERHLGLDPTSGADNDGDFQSDLEEILANTLADDHNSNTPPEDPRDPPFLGEGFELIAQAYDASSQGASPANKFDITTEEDDFPGETLRAHDMHGNLIAEENVRELTAPPALSGQDGAFMQFGTAIDETAWITLSSPRTFGVLDVLTPTRTGREVIKVMQRPINPVAEVITVPGGIDRAADADAWIAQAKLVHGSHETISAVTELRPVDNALSALAEQALFASLQGLSEDMKTDLGVPAEISDFTLFPQRNGESSLVAFSPEMWEALRSSGCDFPAMFAVLEAAAANPTVISLANSIAATHASESETTPLMAFPLDAFRSIIRTAGIEDPAPGDPARPNPYAGISAPDIASAKATFDTALGQIAATKRPTATWFLVIGPSTTPLHNYDYVRQGTPDKVWLVNRFGDRELLEQGLGLAEGTVFEITGFTDVTAPAGFVGFEAIRIEGVVTPLASDTDTNGNLLDDGWENVFFGDLGVVGPFDPHPVTGHSYLQYHLSGADPRSGSLTGPILLLLPTNIHFVWVPAESSYDMVFDFPVEYFDSFDFTLQSSTTLAGFAGPANVGGVQTVAPGTYSFSIDSTSFDPDANFFRIGVSLK